MKIEEWGNPANPGGKTYFARDSKKWPNEALEAIDEEFDRIERFGLEARIRLEHIVPIKKRTPLMELKAFWQRAGYRVFFIIHNGVAWIFGGLRKQGNSTQGSQIEAAHERMLQFFDHNSKKH